jgi:glycosyltransferase involved in cell wall biosynthesis
VRLLAVHHGGGVGGAPVSLLKLLSCLDLQDFDSEAVFTEKGPILEYAQTLHVPSRVVPTGGAFFYSAHARLGARSLARFVRTFPTAVRTAQSVLRQQRPDVLHLNTSVLLAWAAAARRERVPTVWVVREVLGPNPWLRSWHARFISGHARKVVAISQAVAECFPPDAQTALVYNAVDPADFSSELDAGHAKTGLGLDPNRPVIMLIGSVQRAKGHWLLLDALRHLPSDLQTVLVTGGVEPAYAWSWKGRVKRALHLPLDNLDALLRQSAPGQFTVTGFRQDIPRVLRAADLLVFPSLVPEGFGRPIIEAMAAARPVVATDVGPSRELLGTDAGLLVAAESSAIAAAIAELLRDPERRRAMGEAGRDRVAACFSLDRQVAHMSAIYHQVAAIV